MSPDRAEIAGTGVAVAFHAALIAALSLSLARVAHPPEPPAMEVELVDEVGLQAAAPAPEAAPPPAEAPEPVKAAPEPPPPPEVVPVAPPPPPTPAPAPAPLPKKAEPPPPKPAPAKAAPARPAPPRPAPPRQRIGADFLKNVPAPREARIGADFLKGLPNAPAAAKPSAPAISASAMAGIQQAIRRQVQPCADRQINPGPGASKIKVRLHLVLDRSGRLSRAPEVVSTSGVDDDNSRYEERVKDLAVAIISGCAPLTGLPQELYSTPAGGWSNFNMTYSLP